MPFDFDSVSVLLVFGAAWLMLFVLFLAHPGISFGLVIVVSNLVPIEFMPLTTSPRMGPTRIIILTYLMAVAIRVLLANRWNLKPLWQIPWGTAAIYAGFLLISLSQSIDRRASVLFLIDQVSVAGLFFCAFYLLRDVRERQTINIFIVVCTFIVSALAMLEFVRGATIFGDLFSDGDINLDNVRMGIERVRSTFFHPIALGSYINLVLPTLLVTRLRSSGATQATLDIVIIMAVLAQFLTVSRVPWLLLVMEVVYVFMIVRAEDSLSIRSINARAVLIGTLILAVFYFFAKLDLVNQGSSEYYRIALTNAVFDSLSGTRWFFGHGPGTFHLADIRAHFDGHDHVLTAPDLHYVRVLADTGLLGLSAFILLIICNVRSGLQALVVTRGPARGEAAASFAAIVGFICVNFTVSMFYITPLVLLYVIHVANLMRLADPEAVAALEATPRVHSRSPA
jgi:hypothetical protein